MLSKKMKKRWTSLLSVFLALTCCLSTVPFSAFAVDENAKATETAAFVTKAGKLTNLARGCVYESIVSASPSYPDDNNDKLTDGIVADAQYSDKNWVGYYNHGSLEATDIVLDLGEERLISTLEIDSLNAADVGITYPKYVSFSYSMDNVQWSKPVRFDAPTSATPSEVHTFSYSLDAPEKARYVKVTHSIDWWTFFTEIRVMGEQIIEKDPNDIVRGMPYTTSLKDGDGDAGTGDFHREHPDVERTRLTDGAKAIRSDWRDSATVGFHTPTNPAVTDKRIDLTFDFGAVKNFEQIQFSTFKQDAAGILHPSAIVVEYKDAGGSWQKAFEGKMPAFDTVKGNFVFVVPDGQSLSAQAVRLTMTAAAGSSWIFMDEMEILERANGETANINPPVGTSAKPPVITKDLPSLKNTVVGETVTFDVAAKSADGGVLSYQWYKNGETLEGKTTNQLILDKVSTADSGRYYVEITNDLNGQTTIKQSIITVLTVFDQQVEKPKSLIAGKTYTTSLTDQDFHASSSDVNRTKLTDGVFCDIWGTSEIVGYHFSNDMIDIAFNLDSPITFSEIQFGAVSAKDAGIFLPNYVKIEAKNGSTDHYKVIYEGESGSEESKKIYTYGTAIGEAITATNLRFTFKSKGSWLFMDEFEVFADATGKNLDGEIHMDAAAVNNNLLLGKPYVSVTEANASYPDNNYELTDGNRGPLNVTNDRWSAYKDQFSEFIFDLGEETAFEEVKVGMSQDLGAGIQLPQYVNVYTSHDNTNWELISQNGIGVNATSQMLYDFRATMSQKKTARYVKVSIQPNGWLFLDEIEILKNYSTASEEQTNNLAHKKVYLSSPAASSAYPDTFAMTKLTDGKSAAANHTDSAWVGYGVSGKETEIVIDLGTITSFEQVEATFLDDVANGFSTPVAMQVDYSLDKKNWQEATPTAAVAPFSSIPTRSIIQSVVGADSARYVKVKFSAATNVMIDEIKVLKNRTMVGDGTVDPESVDPNNLAFRAAYETSWNADARYADNSKKELTDGACGSDYYNVSGWSGYQAQSETPFSVTVDLGTVKSFEQVQIGALESKTRSFPLSYPKNIKIEYSSDQSQWSVFANATVDREGHGAKQFNYDSHAVSGRYVRFTFDFENWLFLDDLHVFAKKVPLGDTSHPDNGMTYNLARNSTYLVSRPADYRNVQGILTDGIYGVTGSNYDTNWTGFKYNYGNKSFNKMWIDFDLGELKSVSEIVVSSRNDVGNNIVVPENVILWASSDGRNWQRLTSVKPTFAKDSKEAKFVWNAEAGGLSIKPDNASMVYTKYLRVSFDIPASRDDCVYLDEVKILGKDGRCSAAGIMTDPSGLYNVALNKPYTVELDEKSSPEPDIDGKQLTDGVMGKVDGSDPAWVSFDVDYQPKNTYVSGEALRTIIIDLQGTKSITKVQTNVLSCEYSSLPWSVFIHTSMDGVNWTRLGVEYNVDLITKGRYGFSWRGEHGLVGVKNSFVDYIPKDVSAVAAKYVRVDVELLLTNQLDEIEVCGYDGIIEGAAQYKGDRRFDGTGRDYQKAGESTAGVQDMVLCYNGWYGYDSEAKKYIGDWDAERYRPYLTYVDPNGTVKDSMFDAVCLLGLYSAYGRSFNASVVDPTSGVVQIEDWEWYLDKIFREGGDIDELNKAAKIASQELGDPNYKAKLTIMIPGADRTNTHFGPIDGKYFDLIGSEADRRFVNEWWIQKLLKGIEAGNYEYVDFVGFYWLEELVGYWPDTTRWANQRVKELGYKMFWIPFFFANGYLWSQDIGFDAVAYQPNHFFKEPDDVSDAGLLGTRQVDRACKAANYGNLGLELELDSRAFELPGKYNQYLDYLNSAVNNGMDGDGAYRNWYQSVNTLAVASTSKRKQIRQIYDYTYQLMNGTYKVQPYIHDFSDESVDADPVDPSDGGSSGGSIGSARPERPTNPEKPNVGKLTWEKTNGVWKLKGADGKYVTGWKKIDGNWYYMNNDAVMQKGWQEINGRWYYLKDSGAMATGWVRVGSNWYYLNENGAMKTGWQKLGNTWYYLQSSGAMATGWKWIGSKCYYFDVSGKMAVNTTINGYSVNANGEYVSR